MAASEVTPSRPGAGGKPDTKPDSRPDTRPDTPHVQHVKEHLRRLGGGVTAVGEAETVYFGGGDADHFWELVGLRIAGHPSVVLAALRFQRHDYPGAENARESLSAYLASPPRPVGSGRKGQISAYLPRWHESIPAFLARLRAGPDHAPVHLDPGIVQVAFDFRMANPSGMETAKRRAGPMSPFLFRTTGGHVLRGNSHGPPGKGAFVAVTGAEQVGPQGRRALGSVMLHPDFVALAVPLDDEKTRLAAPNWMPFLPATASRRHLLY